MTGDTNLIILKTNFNIALNILIIRFYPSRHKLIQTWQVGHFSGQQGSMTMQYHLGQLSVGEKAIITGFVEGQKEYRAKLLAMGLTKGIELELTRVAPLGDPLEISIRGFSLSLRKEEASVVLVEKD